MIHIIPGNTYPLTTHRLSMAAFTTIHAMYGSGRHYTRSIWAGRNK